MKKYIILFVFIIPMIFSTCSDDNFEESNPSVANVDVEKPSIIIQSPTTEFSYNTIDQNISFSGIAYDNKIINIIQWKLNNESKKEVSGIKKWSVNDISLKNGDNSFIVYVEDGSNNFSSDTILVTKNKYLLFLGNPVLNPSGVFVNESTDVFISAQISHNSNLIRNSVKLINVDENNNEIEEICSLYDDGNLQHGDEIKGDNVFSNIYNFTLNNPIKLRVKAKSNETEGDVYGFSSVNKIKIYEHISSSSIEEILNTHKNTLNKLNEIIKENDLNTTIVKTRNWLASLSHVKNVEVVSGNIDIIFFSGLSSTIMISQKTEDGNSTSGGIIGFNNRDRKQKISIDKQTRGINNLFLKLSSSKNNLIIGNKKVLIFEPFPSYFWPWSYGNSIKETFEQSEYGFKVNHLQEQDCTIDALKSLTDYGFIYFNTHGKNGRWIETGEIIDPNGEKYEKEVYDLKIKAFYNVVYEVERNIFGKQNKIADVWGVSDDFINEELKGVFPNSVIFNNSCESTKSTLLSKAFLDEGAKAYLGFDENVWSSHGGPSAKVFIDNLVIEKNTVGEAFNKIWIKKDPLPPYAEFQLLPDKDSELHFTESATNLDFEYGNLTAWIKEGDGRIITQLGNQTPTEGNYMSIISTGLGFTTTSGQISQSFKVENGVTNIKIDWNFLSEEFLEFVGSQYQDYIKISITEGENEHVVFNKSIDKLNEEYALIDVSPKIVFDIGDVYMTGWQELNIDISNYTNKNITLTIKVGDVGDSVYDSVVLIDDITIE